MSSQTDLQRIILDLRDFQDKVQEEGDKERIDEVLALLNELNPLMFKD